MLQNEPDLATRLDKSGEKLRIVLPLLSKHGSDFGPASYALWFGYIAAKRPALVSELEPFVAAGSRLSLEQTATLYRRHFLDVEATTVENVSLAFVELLTQVASSTISVQATTSRTQELLEALPAAVALESGHAVSHEIAEHSRIIAASLLTFGQQLNRAQAQVDALRDELQYVRQEARIDALTSLQNRRSFDEALLEKTDQAAATGTPLTLIMIDVDHFKRFNDDLGHVMGDRALRAVATTIQQNVKGKDFAARFGGEEFVVLMADTSLESAQRVAENLRQAIERICIRKTATGETMRTITVSCGVALLQSDDAPIDLVDRADGALYLAKEAGRNRVVVSAGRPVARVAAKPAPQSSPQSATGAR